jgi:hypothetical protein
MDVTRGLGRSIMAPQSSQTRRRRSPPCPQIPVIAGLYRPDAGPDRDDRGGG